MSLWTFIKLIAAVCVLGVVAFTGMLAWHVMVEPLDGVFEKVVPKPVSPLTAPSDSEVAKMLESADMPDIDPGDKAYQKAYDLLAMGRIPEAREKLTAVVNVYPGSAAAPMARRIVGEINMDEVLSPSHMAGKSLHVVKRGESFLGIAAKYQTTVDMMVHLNSMTGIKGLHPGDELVVMPLKFRILVEPDKRSVSVWDGGRFLREYPIVAVGEGVRKSAKATKIRSKYAEHEGAGVRSISEHYRGAEKIIHVETPAMQIRASGEDGEVLPGSVFLTPEDLEELVLLTRVGNVVEIR